jgi:hypothetical protein
MDAGDCGARRINRAATLNGRINRAAALAPAASTTPRG